MKSKPSDFLHPVGEPVMGWVLLVGGFVLLSAAMWYQQTWATERATAKMAEQQAQRALAAIRPPVLGSEASLPLRRWQQAQAELNLPWLPALRAVESAATNPVFLLAMSIDPAKRLIRIDAQAPSFDHAIAFVQILDSSGALNDASLLSHEQASEGANGVGVVRFSATAQWVLP